MAWRAIQRELRERLAIASLALQAIAVIIFFLVNYVYPVTYRGGLVVVEGPLARLEASGYGIESVAIARPYSTLISYIVLLEAGLLVVQAAAEISRASRFLGISVNLVAFNFISLGVASSVRLQEILTRYTYRYTTLALADGSVITAKPVVEPVPKQIFYLILILSLAAFVMRGYDWILSEVNAELEELEWESIIYTLIILGIIAFSIATKVVIILPHPAPPQKPTNIVGSVLLVTASNPWGNISSLQACTNWITQPNVTRGEIYIITPPSDAVKRAIVYGTPSSLQLWVKGRVEYSTGINGTYIFKTRLSLLTETPKFQISFLENSSIKIISVDYPVWGVKKVTVYSYSGTRLLEKTVLEGDFSEWPITASVPEKANHVVVRVELLYHGKHVEFQVHLYKGKTITVSLNT